MRLFWIERRHSEVPEGDDWLSAGERQTLGRLRFAKRRDDWRLGRWTAKCAVAALRPEIADFGEIHVERGESGAPAVSVRGRSAGLATSLSHSNGRGFCVVADAPASIGCDVEAVAHRSQQFVFDYFTAAERAMVESQPPRSGTETVNLIWSAKESVSKALGLGLRLNLQSVTVKLLREDAAPGRWSLLAAAAESRGVFYGWWRSAGGFVWTVLSEPGPLPLTELDSAAGSLSGDLPIFPPNPVTLAS